MLYGEKLKDICEKLGINTDALPNKLYSTLLQSISDKIGAPVEIATAEEMDTLLVEENLGKVYMYTGETNDTYTNGNVYQVIEE